MEATWISTLSLKVTCTAVVVGKRFEVGVVMLGWGVDEPSGHNILGGQGIAVAEDEPAGQ